LSEIKQITEHADHGESPCEDVRRIIQHHIRENRARIDEMLKLQNRMGTEKMGGYAGRCARRPQCLPSDRIFRYRR
jgi:DNA-binding transcriptional MerR regulator